MSSLKYKRKMKDQDLREVFSFMKILSESGVSIEESLNLIKLSLNKTKVFDFDKLVVCLKEGKTLCKSLEIIGMEDRFVLSIIEIAELTGKLSEAFGQLEEYYNGKLEIKSEIFKTFAYPITVFISIILLTFGILTYIVPKIVADFFVEGDKLPTEIDLIMNINFWIRDNFYFIFIAFCIIIMLIMILVSNKKSRAYIAKTLAQKSPFAYITNKIYIKNFAWKMCILLKSGIDIYRALEIVKAMEKNLYYKRELSKITDVLISGESITKAARNTHICDDLVITYIDKGSETDKMADAFESIWIVYERYLNDYIKKLKAALQPVTVMILGIIVALLAMLVMSITDVSNFVTEVG